MKIVLPQFETNKPPMPTNDPHPRSSRVERTVPRVTLELLELFIAVAQARTIAAGARTLHMAPSVATRKIAMLEGSLNTRLFDRTTRYVQLTAAGVVALEWAKSVVAGHERLADQLSAMQGELSGTLRLVVNEYVCTELLPPFLTAFSQRYPQIRYSLTMTDTLVSSQDRDYDVAVYSGSVPDSSLMGIRIRSVKRVLCASPAYIARRGMPKALEDLTEHDCLAHWQNAGGSWVFMQGDRAIAQPIDPLLVSNSYLPLIKFARLGLGIISVSSVAVREDLESGRLVQILPEVMNVHTDGALPAIWILYPGGRMLKRTRVFMDELSNYLRQLN